MELKRNIPRACTVICLLRDFSVKNAFCAVFLTVVGSTYEDDEKENTFFMRPSNKI